MTFQEFESGAVRDTQEGKIKFELITPTFKKDLAAMLTEKAAHYGDRNWEKGIPTARTFSSLLRHVEALGRGEWLDEESGHPHTVLAAANIMFIHEFHGTEFDTLDELVGPQIRTQNLVKRDDGFLAEVNEGKVQLCAGDVLTAAALKWGVSATDAIWPIGKVIRHGDPEPPCDTEWRDVDGDVWLWHGPERGWQISLDELGDDTTWDTIPEMYFPMVRVK